MKKMILILLFILTSCNSYEQLPPTIENETKEPSI